jgi:hypothetical protein
MGALTAEGALIYDENVSRKRLAALLGRDWVSTTEKGGAAGAELARGLQARDTRQAA